MNKVKLYCLLIFVTCFGFTKAETGVLTISIDKNKTTPLLNPPYISSVLNSKDDVVKNIGFVVDVLENEKPILKTNYTLQCTSSNTSVVNEQNILIEKDNGFATIKINPGQVGYSNITITLTKEKAHESITVYIAVSENTHQLPNYWHTGFSDASAAISINDSLMLVADDENNVLSVYNKQKSGLPLSVFDYDEDVTSAGESSKEIDCEAAVRSNIHKNVVYFIGSHGNGGKSYEEKPKRNTLMAVTIDASGGAIKCKFKDYYTDLRKLLIKWGDANNYNLSKSAATGEKPKQIGGFNIEGMCFAPDGKTLWIGFRAPLVPVNNRNNALIAPIKNFEEWFNNGHKNKTLEFDKPIELDLGKRGIRDMIQLSNNSYLIVAGSSDESKNTVLYTWTGNINDKPQPVICEEIKNLNVEAVVEVKSNNNKIIVQLMCDDGSTQFYGDGIAAKNLHSQHKKFRSLIFTLP